MIKMATVLVGYYVHARQGVHVRMYVRSGGHAALATENNMPTVFLGGAIRA